MNNATSPIRVGVYIDRKGAVNFTTKHKIFSQNIELGPIHPNRIWTNQFDSVFVDCNGPCAQSAAIMETAWRNMLPVILYGRPFTGPEQNYFADIKEAFQNWHSNEDLHSRIIRCAEKKTEALAGYDLPGNNCYADFQCNQSLLAKVATVSFGSYRAHDSFLALGFASPNSGVLRPLWDIRPEKADAALFKNAYSLDEYILYPGDFAPWHNQLIAAYAARDLEAKIVFCGSIVDQTFLDLAKVISGKNAVFLEEPNPELMASAYAGAKAVCIPYLTTNCSREFALAYNAHCPVITGLQGAPIDFPINRVMNIDPENPDEIAEAISLTWEKYGKIEIVESLHLDKDISAIVPILDEAKKIMRTSFTSFADVPLIYIDLTTSLRDDVNKSGIPRVELNYTRAICKAFPEKTVLVAWDKQNREFVLVNPDKVSGLLSGVDFSHEFNENTSFRPARGSVIVEFGNTFFYDLTYMGALENVVRGSELKLLVLVHDSLQRKFPHWYPRLHEDNVSIFRRICRVASYFFAISVTTAQDIFEFAAGENISIPPIQIVRHGDMEKRVEEKIPGKALRWLHGRAFILFVSGFDLRKNHLLIFDVIKNLAEDNLPDMPALICVGESKRNKFLELAGTDPKLAPHLLILSNIDDEEMEWLYNNCIFTVYPSLYEGWGLPVGESLAHGKICIASNASSIPEIAPEFTDLLHPHDFSAWHKKMKEYIVNYEAREAREKAISQYMTVPWEESGNRFIAQLKKQFYAPLLKPGDVLKSFVAKNRLMAAKRNQHPLTHQILNRLATEAQKSENSLISFRRLAIEASFEQNNTFYQLEPDLKNPVCQIPTFSQMISPEYGAWIQEMAINKVMHRKLWEFVYILQVLKNKNLLKPGIKGLGFGCGREPISSILAKYGCNIIISDYKEQSGWYNRNQQALQLRDAWKEEIVSWTRFEQNAKFIGIDMNHIPKELKGKFDFIWSSCAFEHLGSISHGLAFVRNSAKCLKKGGIAVHTTELNISDLDNSFESPGLSFFRKSDIESLVTCSDFEMLPFNWHTGSLNEDSLVDRYPFKGFPHLKLLNHGYIITSIGIILIKK